MPGIVGMGRAAEVARERLDVEFQRLANLRDEAIREIEKRFPWARLNGARAPSLPGILNVSFPGFLNEELVLRLDQAGIQVAGGSACHSGSLRESHVLQALGVSAEVIRGAIRVSLGSDTTPDQVRRFIDEIAAVVC